MLHQLLKTKYQHPPLSSDAYTGWGKHDQRVHDADVDSATHLLMRKVIPDFARYFEQWAANASRDQKRGLRLSMEMHQRGINMRHLGAVLSLVSPNSEAATLIIVEMIKRTLKNVLRSYIRNEIKERSSAYTIKESVVLFLNTVCGSRVGSVMVPTAAAAPAPTATTTASTGSELQECTIFWQQRLPAALQLRFGVVQGALSPMMSPVPASSSSSSASSPAVGGGGAVSRMSDLPLYARLQPYLYDILQYVLQMSGLQFSSSCRHDVDRRVRVALGLLNRVVSRHSVVTIVMLTEVDDW